MAPLVKELDEIWEIIKANFEMFLDNN